VTDSPASPDDPEPQEPQAPAHWEADVIVADGGIVHLRPICHADADALVAFHGGLSQRTRYLRYFSAYPRIPERDLRRFTHVDHRGRVALVAILGEQIIAVGRYERDPGTDNAEVAFVVADEHQGRGIGSVLLEHLAAAARDIGIKRFVAVILAENSGMLRVFRDAGYEITRHVDFGEVTLEFDVAETETTESVMREREQRAEARSIARLLCPRSVAVVGASSETGKIGNAVFVNLLRTGLDGPLYPINPEARHVQGVRAYPSVHDVPDEIDLAVVAVPAAAVPEVVRQCADRGVRGLVVISGGFGERGDEAERVAGAGAQRELVAAARSHGMRVVGPNCLGIVNTDPAIGLNASLAPLPPLAGRAGFFCQSGALGVAVLGEAARRGLGVSTFVSAGNRADVSGNDMLQFWETDPRTDVAMMYLESFGNPRKFARIARRLGRRKPIVAVKSGTGAVVPGLAQTSVDVPEASMRALFEASGIIRVETVGDLFDVALLLTSQPLPEGPRVAVLGNSTALGVLVTNALADEDLQLARLVDVGVDTSADAYVLALRDALADPAVDAVVAVFVPPLQSRASEDVAAAVRGALAGTHKPVVSTFLGFEGVSTAPATAGDTSPPRGSVPSYSTPERAVRSLARVYRYAEWRRRPAAVMPMLNNVRADPARDLVRSVLTADPAGRELTAEEAGAVLGYFGVLVEPDAVGIGVEFTIHDDQSFGVLMSFGISGVPTDLLHDRAYAAVPLTLADAGELITKPRAAPLLEGYAGGPSTDPELLVDLALRLSALADALPEVVAGVLQASAGPRHAAVTRLMLRVAQPAARVDTGPRRLRGW
jgi:acyl-CoA synthetase (NDP forming)/RimJ/RimL family protein N-acetyltransferase